MRRSRSLVSVVLVIGALATPVLAQKRSRPCAIIANFDAFGKFDPVLVRNTSCDDQSVLVIAVCSLDTNATHELTVDAKMHHKKKNKDYDVLTSDVTLTVGKAAAPASPACAATGVMLADFDDADAKKKPHGTYTYNGTADGNGFDPDLDVSPPTGLAAPKRGVR
jgi:hypothetical protein